MAGSRAAVLLVAYMVLGPTVSAASQGRRLQQTSISTPGTSGVRAAANPTASATSTTAPPSAAAASGPVSGQASSCLAVGSGQAAADQAEHS